MSLLLWVFFELPALDPLSSQLSDFLSPSLSEITVNGEIIFFHSFPDSIGHGLFLDLEGIFVDLDIVGVLLLLIFESFDLSH
jgi:hypothetical protein